MADGIFPLIVGLEPDTIGTFLPLLIRAGIRAFILPGELVTQPFLLESVAATCRHLAAKEGVSDIVLAIGPHSVCAASLPVDPSPLSLAALGKPASARRAGSLLGAIIDSSGVDMVMSPHLSTRLDPKKPGVILDSFGEDSETASRLVSNYIEGIRSENVGVCAFGATTGQCGSSKESMKRGSGVRDFPQTSPNATLDAVLSAALTSGISALVLQWLNLSSNPEIGTIAANKQESSVFLIAETGDLSLIDHTAWSAVAACGFDAILVADAAKAFAFLDTPDSCLAGRRFTRFLDAAGTGTPGGRLPSVLSSPLKMKVERDRLDSITVVRDDCAFDGSSIPDCILLFFQEGIKNDVMISFSEMLKRRFPEATLVQSGQNLALDEVGALASRIVASAELIGEGGTAVAFTCNAHMNPGQETLVRMLAESFPRFSVIATADPYDLSFFPEAYGLAALYGVSNLSMSAAADLLSGSIKPKAELPLLIPGIKSRLTSAGNRR